MSFNNHNDDSARVGRMSISGGNANVPLHPSVAQPLAALAGIISGLAILAVSVDTEETYSLLDNGQYTVQAVSENSYFGNLLGTKNDFKSLSIIKNQGSQNLAQWGQNSGVQHIGISYIQPDSYSGDNTVCWGSEQTKPNAYNCYNQIRLSALETKLGKEFISKLDKQ